MPDITLAQINASLFAHLLPATHGPKPTGKKKDVEKPTFTEDELAACAAAGVDASKLTADELAAVVAAHSIGK